MLSKILLLLCFTLGCYSSCVTISRKELQCVNEFGFERVYARVEKLTLINSFIAYRQLKRVFPSLKDVHVRGSYAMDECNQLQHSYYNVFGCPGKIFFFFV